MGSVDLKEAADSLHFHQPHRSQDRTGRAIDLEAFSEYLKTGVSNLLASLGHTGRRVVLGHTLNTQTLTKTDRQEKKKKDLCIIFHHQREAKMSSHNNPNYAEALSIIFLNRQAGPKFVITNIENVHI